MHKRGWQSLKFASKEGNLPQVGKYQGGEMQQTATLVQRTAKTLVNEFDGRVPLLQAPPPP